MRRAKALTDAWDAAARRPANWLPVDASALTAAQRLRFRRRKRALELYLSTDRPIAEVLACAGLSRTELYRIVGRAFEARPDGDPVGYLACLPHLSVKPYTRTTTSGRGAAGRFAQFLAAHPDVRDDLDAWILGRRAPGPAVVRGRQVKQIWLAFREVCHSRGLDLATDYPFCNRDGGREAVRRYAVRRRATDAVAGARVVHGDAAGRLAAGGAARTPESVVAPYELVQLDGHRIDAVFTVRVPDPAGEPVELPMARPWLLVLIDAASRAVLGHALSLRENYCADDVLRCVASSMTPWTPRELPGTAMPYAPGAGLPNGTVAGCERRLFTTLQLDNAWSHHAGRVQTRLIGMGVTEIVTNPPASPRSNAIVERFMRTFEAAGFHQAPNTTGSEPSDPRRRDPDRAAARLGIDLEDLENLVDLVMCSYNAEPHAALSGRSPLDSLRDRLERGRDLVRRARPSDPDGLGLFEQEHGVTIRASLAHGHRPHVTFRYARYTSEVLRLRGDLAGRRATLRVDARDIRRGHLFLEAGECVGEVHVEARWASHPHGADTRAVIARLVKDGKLAAAASRPLADYYAWLARRARMSRPERNALLRLQRELEVSNADDGAVPLTVPGPDAGPPTTPPMDPPPGRTDPPREASPGRLAAFRPRRGRRPIVLTTTLLD